MKTLENADFRIWLGRFPRRTLVMGILNVTPDSFSDGGAFCDVDAAVARAQQMANEGADLIDIGGESTRPGSLPVEPDEQIRRVVPVIRAIRRRPDAPVLSIDTTSAKVAEAALDAGAGLINDISGARFDPEMLPLAARTGVPIVLMHILGRPQTMQDNPVYQDVVAEVLTDLRQRRQAAIDAGVPAGNILLDPGIGFGKAMEHNLQLLRRLRDFADIDHAPLLVGTSRKGFIGRITGEDIPANRVFGSVATAAHAVANGAAIVRVHDVKPTVQVVRMIEAILHPPAA